MSDLIRASLSIDSQLMEQFDDLIQRSGHSNRSEAMRDLIRARLQEEDWEQGQEAMASVTLVYDHRKRRISREIEEHGHVHHHVVLSSMHIHVTPDMCLEVVVLRGAPQEIKHVANHLLGMPGVIHGKAVYSRTDILEEG
jgi:CopG family nickel-responsive transcriptional regulator